MKQTPITKSIEQIRIQAEDYRKRGNYEQDFMLIHKSEALFDSIKLLQSLLPYERECIEGAYDAGIATTSGMQTSDFKCGTKYYSQTFNHNNPQGGGGE